MKKYLLYLSVITLSLNCACGANLAKKKKKKNEPIINIEEPDKKDMLPPTPPTSTPTPSTPVTTPTPTPTPEKPKVDTPSFTITRCFAKFWSFNYQYYSMIAINPSTNVNLSSVMLNNQEFQLNDFNKVASIGDGNFSLIWEMNQWQAGIPSDFTSNYPNALILFMKQHSYTVWGYQNLKFNIEDQTIDIRSVCPPLPYLPPAIDPRYRFAIMY